LSVSVKGAALADGRLELKRRGTAGSRGDVPWKPNREQKVDKRPEKCYRHRPRIGVSRMVYFLRFDACLESLSAGAETDKADRMRV
jgi:hypothetical protein